ncbi:hypothetical protein ELI30_05810 [Rhizobium leguminosarum]|nr:hypothetical protein ELI32_05810 [Rhizobium leguminosarum]TAV57355.1 hypothetical protein ELI31_05810 [Rhizobium leguminosarum]TAV68294.1 hypothetical protein ELI30_05810 [Rhizobium leguminosarum]TAY65979.1 hypothetical protein ELH82_07105 [Rhizobium leguminosarum]
MSGDSFRKEFVFPDCWSKTPLIRPTGTFSPLGRRGMETAQPVPSPLGRRWRQPDEGAASTNLRGKHQCQISR